MCAAPLCSHWCQGRLKPRNWITWRLPHTCPLVDAGCPLSTLVSCHGAPHVISLLGILWLCPITVPGSPRMSVSWKVNHLEAVFFSLPRLWWHTTPILTCLLLGQSRAKAFCRLKSGGPRPHLPAGGEILQSRKKSLWDGDTQWRSYLHHANAERHGIEKIVVSKHRDPKPLEK